MSNRINYGSNKKENLAGVFELVKSGKKKFELRLADFDIKEGDTLVLKEWDLEIKNILEER